MTHLCPDCSTQMRQETVHGVQLDVCPKCAGIWFDAEEMRALLTRDPLALSALEDKAVPSETKQPPEQEPVGPSTRRCPACQLGLQQSPYLYTSPIVLDICLQCGGFFVDDGELGKMQQVRDQRHRPLTAAEEVMVLMGEAAPAHDKALRRQENLVHFLNALRRYQPGWIGLIP